MLRAGIGYYVAPAVVVHVTRRRPPRGPLEEWDLVPGHPWACSTRPAHSDGSNTADVSGAAAMHYPGEGTRASCFLNATQGPDPAYLAGLFVAKPILLPNGSRAVPIH
jgi:hypothetical protein